MVARANRPLRFGILALVCLGVFAALFARLWYLQVLNAPAYEHVAMLTSTRTVRIPAPRGRILDRDGKVLVDNVPTKVVAIDRQKLDDAANPDAVLSRLAALLNRFENPDEPYTVRGIEQDLAVNRVGPFDPVPLAENVSEPLLVELIEHRADYPGVVAETRLLRQYHYGNLAAQVLGRVGPIPEEMWKAHRDDAQPYPNDAQVGLSGVEQSMEKYLRGDDGKRVVEVTPAGKIVRTVKSVPPVPGHDVELTIDIDAQATAEAALATQVKAMRETPKSPPVPGAASVLMQPGTGQVVAMASYPTFDPASFVPTISQAEWDALRAPEANKPMVNRAIAGQYPAGSTFKLVSALAGLRAGVITPTSIYVDKGVIDVGGREFTNDAGEGALGPIALPMALTRSSNVYFFHIGKVLWEGRARFGDDVLPQAAKDLGFGAPTGVDLPDEVAGVVPSPEWRKEMHEKFPDDYDGTWYTGSNLNLAVGQQDVKVTPLQLANAYAQLANNGDRYRPTLLLRVLKPFAELDGSGVPVDPGDVVQASEPVETGHVDLPPDWRAAMMQGFTGVTANSLGTASSAFEGFPLDTFPVAGKTGTAQNGEDPRTGLPIPSDGWFVGFGPANDPQYVAVSVLEQAGYGSQASAPVVRTLFEPVANGESWPTVEPMIPMSTRTAPTGSAPTTTSVPGAPRDGVAPSSTTPVPGQSAPDTTETTTPGPVATGGR